jgi:hypothetical protein
MLEDRAAPPLVDLADDTYLACAPDVVASVVADERRWGRWWPDLHLITTRDRGPKGRQWAVRGALAGTMEIWLEPWWDGVVLHLYLRADPIVAEASRRDDHDGRWAARERQRRAQQWKRHVHRLKDELEAAREQ